jgi:hypothetical protein
MRAANGANKPINTSAGVAGIGTASTRVDICRLSIPKFMFRSLASPPLAPNRTANTAPGEIPSPVSVKLMSRTERSWASISASDNQLLALVLA